MTVVAAARLACCLFYLLFSSLVFAQNSAHANKNVVEVARAVVRRQTILVERIFADSSGLKLAENRAFVNAKVGNLIWKDDEKRARALFQNAVAELIAAQALAESDKKHRASLSDLLGGQTIRPQILNLIAARDAESAIKYLNETRPVKIAKALSAWNEKSSQSDEEDTAALYAAQSESILEQTFLRLAAEQKPERATEFLNASLKKGFSGETFYLLKKVFEKDADRAAAIASEIAEKLIQNGFDAANKFNPSNIDVALSLLEEFTRERADTEKTLKLDAAQMRRLADKTLAFFTSQTELSDNNGGYNADGFLRIAEKLAPDVAARLKHNIADNRRKWNSGSYDSRYNSPIVIVKSEEEDGGHSPAKRRRLAQETADKFFEQGNLQGATEILNANFSGDALDEKLENLNWLFTLKFIRERRYGEAERVIDRLPEDKRVGMLVELAQAIYEKNPADNKAAVLVLEKALVFVLQPEDTGEMMNLMKISAAYASIDLPCEAFRLFESAILQINEYAEAFVIAVDFQKGSSNFRQREISLASGNRTNLLTDDNAAIGKLAEKDFERALSLTDAFSRRETRIALKIQLAAEIFSKHH